VKSKSAILKRLKKLRVRYARSYIKDSQRRAHRNCIYNHEQEPLRSLDPWILEGHAKAEVELAPCRTEIIIASSPDRSTAFYCSYGSDDSENWSGIICDKDEIAKECKWFIPEVSPKEARDKFLRLMADDEYIYNNYRDIAVLQWVLDDRVHRHALSWWEELVIWFRFKFLKPKPPAALPPAEDIPEDLWNDSSKDS